MSIFPTYVPDVDGFSLWVGWLAGLACACLVAGVYAAITHHTTLPDDYDL
jgi:ABC-type uncharacterized transport system permease subunit